MVIWYHSLSKYCISYCMECLLYDFGNYNDSYYECDFDDDDDNKINKIIVLSILVLQ